MCDLYFEKYRTLESEFALYFSFFTPYYSAPGQPFPCLCLFLSACFVSVCEEGGRGDRIGIGLGCQTDGS